MNQLGFLDFDIRLDRIDKAGDPLTKLNEVVNWEMFRPTLDKVRKKERQNNSGPKGYDAILLFKILILQSLYRLSDEAMEFQILDRYSFSRFLGLHAASSIPDRTTIWLFREQLSKAGVIEELFSQFDAFLQDNGFRAQKGQIIDASITRVPVQRNSREENGRIKQGEQPEGWNDKKKRQKDTDARWTKKNGKSFFGYKNHISTDVKNKLIRRYKVTSAEVHDSNVFNELLDPANTSRDIWADSAYRSQERLQEPVANQEPSGAYLRCHGPEGESRCIPWRWYWASGGQDRVEQSGLQFGSLQGVDNTSPWVKCALWLENRQKMMGTSIIRDRACRISCFCSSVMYQIRGYTFVAWIIYETH